MRAILSCFLSFLGKLFPKMSPLLLGEILGVFFNTLNSDGKYLVEDCENSQIPIQIELCEKRQPSFQFLVPFLESRSTLKHFETKDDCHS